MGFKITAATLVVAFSLAGAQQKVVGYYPDWGYSLSPPVTWAQIDYSQVTHIAWSFLYPAANGALNGFDAANNSANLDSIVSKAHAHGVKVIVSLGGAGQCAGFAPMSQNATARALFTHNVKQFVLARHLDGVDIDWEYSATPSAQDTAGYTTFIHEMRDTLGTGMLLTAAVPCSNWWARWISISGILADLDWLGVMTYDITGSWDSQSGYDSPLYNNALPGLVNPIAELSVSSAMAYWNTTRGVPKAKLLYGQPLYGYLFTQGTGPGKAFSGNVNYLNYNAALTQMSTWTIHWDDTAKANWATTPSGGYVTWDDPHTAAMKARWAKDNSYAGGIVWEISEDYVNGTHPMLDSMAKVLLGTPTAVRGTPVLAQPMLQRNGLSLSLHLAQGEAGELSLMDVQGHQLRTSEGVGHSLQLSLSGLSSGVYVACGKVGSALAMQNIVVP